MEEQDGIIDENREFEVKEPQTLEDGKHSGVIVKIIYRETPYSYADLHIIPNNVDMELKVGYPQVVSPTSAFGELLTRFGANLLSGTKINPTAILKDKRVEFVTISELGKSKDGKQREYSRIVRDSVKPEKKV